MHRKLLLLLSSPPPLPALLLHDMDSWLELDLLLDSALPLVFYRICILSCVNHYFSTSVLIKPTTP